jgi:hypothetical protein
VSELWTSPSGDDEATARRRAVFGLITLAIVALLIVGLMVLFFGRGQSSGNGDGPAGAVPPLAGEPSTTSTPPSASTRVSSSPTTRPTRSTSTPVNCPSPAPCAIEGDAGVIAALNTLRTTHNLTAVPGAVTAAAQQCALTQGNGPSCEPSYAWQPVPTHDGAAAISLIAGRNTPWLLDSAMTSFGVGWALVPGGPGTAAQYWCAIVKVG